MQHLRERTEPLPRQRRLDPPHLRRGEARVLGVAAVELPPHSTHHARDDVAARELAYPGQQWQDLHKSHAKDILIHWPDGHTTKGIEKHIEDLKWMFTFAPDNRIQEHPIRFGTPDGKWTAVTGWMEGTFSKPMTTPDGKTVQPTGKKYRFPMATIGRWENGVMVEEFLYWDNGAFVKQIGLAQ